VRCTTFAAVVGDLDADWAKSWLLDRLRVAHGRKRLVAIHRQILGKADGRFDGLAGPVSFWRCDGWAVYVNNDKGMFVEVPEGSTQGDAWTAWRDYMRAVLPG